MKKILLTIDLEEFDLPREFNQEISEEEMYALSKSGLDNLMKLVSKHDIELTFFATANFAKKYPQTIKELSSKHEIASHGYSHSSSAQSPEHIWLAKEEKEKIVGKKIRGFRAPRWGIKNIDSLSDLGLEYDSSTHPIFLPGRYMNLNQRRDIHKRGNIIEIPLSTLPIVNLSIFWLAFKNFPLIYSKLFTRVNFSLVNSPYTMLVFHPWEFTNIKKFNVSPYIKRNHIMLLNKLEKYIIFCKKKGYKFSRIDRFLEG